MKAKNSLWGMLWPLFKQISRMENRLFISKKPQRPSKNPFSLDFQKVADDGKRISEKMQAMQLLAEQSKLQNKSPSDLPVSGESNNTDLEKGRILCGWRWKKNCITNLRSRST